MSIETENESTQFMFLRKALSISPEKGTFMRFIENSEFDNDTDCERVILHTAIICGTSMEIILYIKSFFFTNRFAVDDDFDV